MTSAFNDINTFAEEKLETLEARHIRRALAPTARHAGGTATRGGDQLISFCDNDYLGLSQDPRVITAGNDAAERYGAGAGASRLVTGDCPLNGALEQKIAELKGAPAAKVFGSGYLANIGVIPVLAGPGDVIIMDALSHSCLHAGAKLSGADVEVFQHNDVSDAGRALAAHKDKRRKLVVTETIFSMDGDAAPLTALGRLCEEAGGWLLTDDAHGFGVVAMANPAPVQVGTLSKAVGGYGGYVCGPESFIDLLTSRARSFVYTTGLPPFTLGASLAALGIIEREPALSARVMAHAALFAELAGLPAPQSAIIPVIIGEAADALAASEALRERGFLVSAIRQPTVPAGTARLRICMNAAHREDDVRGLAAALKDVLSRLGSTPHA